MKKKYIIPEITIYKTEITNALMNVSGGVSAPLDKQGGSDNDGEEMTAKKSFNIWDD